MEIYRKLEKSEYPQSIALGFFDGVHLGHKAVIENAAKASQKTAVLTFSENPSKELFSKTSHKLISNEDKLECFEKLGVDAVYMLDFSDIKDIEAESFLEDILLDTLKVSKISCGYNYRFGKGGKGDTNLIRSFGEKNGIEINITDEVFYENKSISSTKIRSLIENGEMALANKLLGKNFGFKSQVEYGRQIGSKIGFPTLNQQFPKDFVMPKFGVYVSQVMIDGKYYRSITNVGVKPTVKSDYALAETHIFDFSGDLYGKTISLELMHFLRAEKKFESIEELRKTIASDCEKARNFIK